MLHRCLILHCQPFPRVDGKASDARILREREKKEKGSIASKKTNGRARPSTISCAACWARSARAAWTRRSAGRSPRRRGWGAASAGGGRRRGGGAWRAAARTTGGAPRAAGRRGGRGKPRRAATPPAPSPSRPSPGWSSPLATR